MIVVKIILDRERGEGLDETVLALVSCMYVVVHCAVHFIFVSFDHFCEVKMIKVSSPIALRRNDFFFSIKTDSQKYT